MDIQSYKAAIDLSNVQTMLVTGTYYLGGFPSAKFIDVAKPERVTQQFLIADNLLSGFGIGLLGIKIATSGAQKAVLIKSNCFFDFNARRTPCRSNCS